MSCLLYGADVWGFNHGDIIERLQLQFFKKTFGVTNCSPSYAVRLEAGRCKTEVTVYKMMLKLWVKILKMPEHRTPRKLYNRLKTLSDRTDISNNWVSQIYWILQQVGYDYLWEATDPTIVEDSLEDIIRKLALISWEEDWNFARTSSSSYYHHFQREDPIATFVTTHPYRQRRVISQLRLASRFYPFILLGDNTIGQFDPSRQCECCNLKSYETITHFLFVCPCYQVVRSKLLLPHLISLFRYCEDDDLIDILYNPSEELTCDLYLFVSNCLKIRKFVLEE